MTLLIRCGLLSLLLAAGPVKAELQAETAMRGEVKGQTSSCRDLTEEFLAWYVPLALGVSKEPPRQVIISLRIRYFTEFLTKRRNSPLRDCALECAL